MNTTRFNKAIQELHALRMNPQEKAALYANLQAKIAAGHLPQSGGAVQGIVSPWSKYSFREWMGMHRIASVAVAVFAIVVLGGGGAAFAAQGSLPGDRLYSLKVAIVEPIRGAVFISAESKARWEAQLVAARIAEADELQAQGRYDQDKQDEVRSQVALHTHAFEVAAQSAPASESLAEAQVSIDQGVTFLASSGSDTGVSIMSATLAMPTVAAKAALMVNATATIPAAVPASATSAKVRAAAPVMLNADAVLDAKATAADQAPASPHVVPAVAPVPASILPAAGLKLDAN